MKKKKLIIAVIAVFFVTVLTPVITHAESNTASVNVNGRELVIEYFSSSEYSDCNFPYKGDVVTINLSDGTSEEYVCGLYGKYFDERRMIFARQTENGSYVYLLADIVDIPENNLGETSIDVTVKFYKVEDVWDKPEDGTYMASCIMTFNTEPFFKYSGDFSYYVCDDQKTAIIDEWIGDGNTSTITVPETVSYNNKEYTVSIVDWNSLYGGYDYSNRNAVTTINIPKSLKSSYNDNGIWYFGEIDSIVANGFQNLKAVNVDEKNAVWKSIDGVVYSKNGKTLEYYPPQKEDRAFTVPKEVEEIESESFYYDYDYDVSTYENLESIELSSVKIIGSWAFRSCNNLRIITIPASVEKIGYEAFLDSGIKEVTFLSENTQIGECAFGYYKEYNQETDEDEYVKMPDFRIKCLKNSTAEKYAKENGFAYEYIEKPNASSAVVEPNADAAKEKSDADAVAKAETEAKTKAGNVNKATVSASDIKKASNLGLTSVTLGPKVKKIKKNAFRGTKIKTVTVKTKKLTAKSVKGSLKGSKVKKVKVKVGKKSVNKKYVKKYKKIFTKKNAGKKVSVK